MLRIDSRNMNYNGVSMVGDTIIAGFNANVNEPENNAYLNINIQNMSAMRTNIIVFEADLNSFIDEISSLVSSSSSSNV